MLLEGGQGREQLLPGDVGVSTFPQPGWAGGTKNTFRRVGLGLCGADLTLPGLLVFSRRMRCDHARPAVPGRERCRNRLEFVPLEALG